MLIVEVFVEDHSNSFCIPPPWCIVAGPRLADWKAPARGSGLEGLQGSRVLAHCGWLKPWSYGHC